MRERIERAEWKSRARFALGVIGSRPVIAGSPSSTATIAACQPDLDRCERRIDHGYSRSSRNGSLA